MVKKYLNFKTWCLLQYEIASLVLTLIFLPSFEAPKHLFLIIYVVLNIARQFKDGSLFKTNRSDLVFLFLISSLFLSTIFSTFSGEEWRGLRSNLPILFFGWILARSNYKKKILEILFVISILSFLPTFIYGAYEHFFLKRFYFFKIHSVGFVNASGIYLALMTGAALSIAITSVEKIKKYFFFIIFLFFYIGLLYTVSRTAFAQFLITGLIITFASIAYKKSYIFGLLSLLIITIIFNAPVIQKQLIQQSKNEVLAERDMIWNVAFEFSRSKSSFFGVGPKNYGLIDSNIIRESLDKRGELYDSSRYKYTDLTHNIYLSFFIERGVFGFLCLIGFMLFWIENLISTFKSRKECFYLWGGSLSAFLSVFLAGLAHTTFSHEQGILALFFFGLHEMYSKLYLKKKI
jgi:O-antigen ligase